MQQPVARQQVLLAPARRQGLEAVLWWVLSHISDAPMHMHTQETTIIINQRL